MTAVPAFSEVAPELELRGFEPVPIRPGSKAPAPEAWQQGSSASAWVSRYAHCGTGLLTRRNPAADADIRQLDAVEAVDRLAVLRLGDAPLRIGLPPKRLRLYRTEAPFAKIASRELALPGDGSGDKPHKIEFLADGQQCVIYAVHPDTRRPYVWPDASPLDLEWQDLPLIDAERAGRFVSEAEALLIGRFHARPKMALRGTRASTRSWQPGPAPRPVHDLGEARAVLATLDRLPNADLAYDDWIKVGYALKAALGEAGVKIFAGWSATSSKDNPEVTAKAWKSIRPVRCGWRYLTRLAGSAP